MGKAFTREGLQHRNETRLIGKGGPLRGIGLLPKDPASGRQRFFTQGKGTPPQIKGGVFAGGPSAESGPGLLRKA